MKDTITHDPDSEKYGYCPDCGGAVGKQVNQSAEAQRIAMGERTVFYCEDCNWCTI